MLRRWRAHYLCLPRLVNGRHVLALDPNMLDQIDVLHARNLHLSVDMQRLYADISSRESGSDVGLQKPLTLRYLYLPWEMWRAPWIPLAHSIRDHWFHQRTELFHTFRE